MISEVCIDANLVVKWYVPEIWRDEAVHLFDTCIQNDIAMIAPDVLFAEAGATLRRKVSRQEISSARGQVAVLLLRDALIDRYDVRDLYAVAWRLAETHRLPTLYDAYYMALAELRGCDFWTADDRFVNSVGGLPSYVRHIRDFAQETLED